MRTTLNLDADLVKRASDLTGIDEKTGLMHEALRALIARESFKRLVALGGTVPGLEAAPRRRGASSGKPPRAPRRGAA
jgi:Arc/MetJ family transcription regulator